MNDALAIAYPRLAARLPRVALATLPTPVTEAQLMSARGPRVIAIKHDNLTGEMYGGNKVRKLEYLLGRARNRRVDVILLDDV